MKVGKVAVLLGGRSAERDVSLNSGGAVARALLRQGIQAETVDVGPDIIEVLQRGQFDFVFNMLHGREGEDGRMQALLEFLHLPYCGSGVVASALAMDKVRSKWIWQRLNIPTLPFMILSSPQDFALAESTLGFPMAVKPVHEGSSNGVSKVKTLGELPAAFELAASFQDQVMAEPWAAGGEYTVSIVGDTVYPSIKISTPKHEFYNYEAKYLDDFTVYDCPSGLTDAEETYVKGIAKQAFDALGCVGWGRVDILKDASGQFHIVEINTIPGMTDHSLVPKAARAVGVDFDTLVMKILETAF